MTQHQTKTPVYGVRIRKAKGGDWLRTLLARALILLMAPVAAYAQFNYTTNSDGVSLTITGYTGLGGAVAIPTTINGLTVTIIGANAFAEQKNITSITIPDSILNIGMEAFEHCRGLTSLTIPDSVTNIGLYAFLDGANLGTVTIGRGVTSLGDYAFEDSGMTNVTISSNTTNIGADVFLSCGNLSAVTVPGNFGYSSFDSCFQFCFDLTNVTVANGTLNIEDELFEDCGLIAGAVLPATLTGIGAQAFENCSGLNNITIPAAVTNLGTNAFNGCSALTDIFFLGNAPSADASTFGYAPATAYYLPGTVGWSNTLAGIPVVLWNPVAQPASFGVSNNQFGFNITGTPNIPVVVEACTNLSNPLWTPVQQLTLTNGLAYFSDPQWTNYPDRYYRIRSPH